MKKQQQFQTTAMLRGLNFCILELPVHIICDILSRLPLKTIICCKCVCKLFLKLLTDPYFAKVHLTNSSTAALIIRESFSISFYIYMLNLDETTSTACSTDDPLHRFHPSHALNKKNAELRFRNGEATLVGSCNGLLCLYSNSSKESSYYICNPILGEYMVVPSRIPSTPFCNYLNHSGFGFCPRTNQYKVIRFLRSTDFEQNLSKTVAEIHTLGTDSWRSIKDAPCPKAKGSFDSLLNGALHWIADSRTTSDLICSFDLETEQFRPVPPPAHFDTAYTSKISWINVGALGGWLCICYVFSDAQFEVWVMKDYGVKESWIKEFVIDTKFYCGLRVEDLHQPIKFLNNGELWLICGSKSLVIYSPEKGTFRDFKTLELPKAEVIAHIPSFISLKDTVIGKSLNKVKNVKWESHCCFNI
ncbi:F-box protein At3g07870-like [Cornus florida]|uniref:F-box protein At3g07870-like n=1 Tax=Cornus florida TaxID=4283 RepID=UPI00289A341F|nr:F-box protein At3g07870-like [Cornus florida]XP_059652058.1 F-box protein At3g07870-like [Cornus florida]XP_059652059.1 F-box protein At3g07870-like [Cornus florida]XP_059652060.1 F-box protein At3g07870-like [Cornus florida]XP_059652061.1 F-box protein At3g07870-like [Cornus florida]XP_059652062.1 F-box protein At3g07870-like [Cornus florida]XP_059652063.1 F-box protein At3g07870-like [Cornus florida]XP_059652064.1 F-box protein At3g07870-like [Cornus florida]XP_059652065.1 F-box protei